MIYKDCKLIITAQNAGGEGKSTWTEAMTALSTIASLDPLIFDADPGMRGFRNRSGSDGLIELGWNEGHSAGEDGVTWCEKHYADRKLVLIDTGANFFSATHRVQRYLFEAIDAALELGIKVAIHVVVGTNKAGSFQGAVDFHTQFSQHVDVVLVRNNRDGSEEFGESKLSPNWTATINIPHLAPGLQAYRLSRAEPLLGILRNPNPGYAMASAMVAQWLLRLARTDYMRSIFGDIAERELATLSALAPKSRHYALANLRSVKDEALQANAAVSRAWQAFRTASPDANSDVFNQTARELWFAEKAYHAVSD